MGKLKLIFIAAILSISVMYAQTFKSFTKPTADRSTIIYTETCESIDDVESKFKEYSSAKIVLKNISKDENIDIKPKISKNKSSLQVRIKFTDDSLKDMTDDDFNLIVDDSVLASTETTSTNVDKNPLTIDLKPSLDLSSSQKVDLDWARKLSASGGGLWETNLLLSAKGAFSTKPDSAALNSVQLKVGYNFIYVNADVFKYFGLSANVGSEHPQDFSETNLVGSAVLSTVVPYTDLLAKLITNNRKAASFGLLIEPAVEFVKNTAKKDSSFIRGAIHGNWIIPLFNKQCVSIYGVAYFQNGYRPRSYIEMTFEQDLTSSIAVIGKWINGELPPLFERESDFRIGLRFK